MSLQEILDKIDAIIKEEDSALEENKEEVDGTSRKNTVTEIIHLLMQVFLNVLRAPINLIVKYLRSEIIASVKKDVKLYTFIAGVMGVLILFFAVLWLFISIAVGVYFQEKGNSLLVSMIYSIGFQVLSILFVSLIAYIASRRIKSLKILSNLADYK